MSNQLPPSQQWDGWPPHVRRPYGAEEGFPRYGDHHNASPDEPTKTMAVWALVLSCIPCGPSLIVGFVLAIVVLTKPKDGYNRGRGLAIAAVIIAPVWIVLLVAFTVLGAVLDSGSTSSGSSGSTGPSGIAEGDVTATSIRVGDCLAEDTTDKVSITIPVTACTNPHASEAYANFNLPAGAYPGKARIFELSDTGCAKRFEDYVGVPFDDSELEVSYLFPTKDSWDVNRGVTCLVADGPSTTGSLKGANR